MHRMHARTRARQLPLALAVDIVVHGTVSELTGSRQYAGGGLIVLGFIGLA